MAFSADDLDRIDRAMTGNLRRVTFADGRSQEFHSPAEMLQVRAMIKAEIDAVTQPRRRRFTVARVVTG